MSSTNNWWRAEIDWNTPAGLLLKSFLDVLPRDRPINVTVYGSAPLQLTVDKTLLSGDVDLFSDDEQDFAALVDTHKLGKDSAAAVHLELGFEMSFRTSPR